MKLIYIIMLFSASLMAKEYTILDVDREGCFYIDLNENGKIENSEKIKPKGLKLKKSEAAFMFILTNFKEEKAEIEKTDEGETLLKVNGKDIVKRIKRAGYSI